MYAVRQKFAAFVFCIAKPENCHVVSVQSVNVKICLSYGAAQRYKWNEMDQTTFNSRLV